MGAKIMRALFIGRFQPFHKGHLSTVRQILENYDELIIMIGSAQYSHTLRNPFSAGERIEIIKETLMDNAIPMDSLYIIPVPDTGIHPIWVAHVQSLVPKFDVVFTHNPLVRRLFLDKGITVRQTKLLDRKHISGTEIRKKIANQQRWEDFVPEKASEIIKLKGLDQRIIELFGEHDKND